MASREKDDEDSHAGLRRTNPVARPTSSAVVATMAVRTLLVLLQLDVRGRFSRRDGKQRLLLLVEDKDCDEERLL